MNHPPGGCPYQSQWFRKNVVSVTSFPPRLYGFWANFRHSFISLVNMLKYFKVNLRHYISPLNCTGCISKKFKDDFLCYHCSSITFIKWSIFPWYYAWVVGGCVCVVYLVHIQICSLDVFLYLGWIGLQTKVHALYWLCLKRLFILHSFFLPPVPLICWRAWVSYPVEYYIFWFCLHYFLMFVSLRHLTYSFFLIVVILGSEPSRDFFKI